MYSIVLEQNAQDSVDVLYDHVLSNVESDRKPPFKYSMLSKIYDQEIFALMNMLGLIKRTGLDYRGRNATAFELTSAGKKIYDVIEGGRRALVRPPIEQRKYIFLLGHFHDKQIASLFTKELGPACIEVGYKPIRLDADENPAVISKKLFQEINVCELILADVTHLTPAIFFQLGYAYGMGINIVFTCRIDAKRDPDELVKRMPFFTTEDLNVLYWGRKSDQSFAWQDGMTPEKKMRTLL
ncbi:MAG: hypothetical protein P9L99_16505 [Candidatus Lernaella stagnicola]|nr:hypothetical protein [Candidatus Lernaella stagnicola]